MHTVAHIARIFVVEPTTVKTWAYKFRDYLNPEANPPKGATRAFTQHDIIVLALVAQYWEDQPDYEHIYALLNRGDYQDERYVRIAYLNSPLLQPVPNDLEEPARDTVFFGGMRQEPHEHTLHIAQAYKSAGDQMVQTALAGDTAYEFLYPIFFMYRHAIEVYLKLLLPSKDDTHDLSRLIDAFHNKYNTEFAQWANDRLKEFHKIDPFSDRFRYADSSAPPLEGDFALSLRQLRVVVDHLCTGFKNKFLDSSIPPSFLW